CSVCNFLKCPADGYWLEMSAVTLKNNPLLKRLVPVLGLVAICWAVFFLNNVMLNGQLNQYGIRPRYVRSFPGIFCAPFLHGSLQHLLANTLPLTVLGAILCLRGRSEFGIVTVSGIVLSGGLTWLIGRNAYH